MKNIFLALILTMFMGAGFVSCQALSSIFGEDTVVTTSGQVVEGAETAVIPTDQLPDSIKDQFPEGTVFVMADKGDLVEGATSVPLSGEVDDTTFDTIVGTVLGVASTFVPGLAAWEGVLTLFSKRKRKHYVKAAKAVLPTDNNIDLGGMVTSLAAAVGASHTSVDTANLSDEEDLEEEEV